MTAQPALDTNVIELDTSRIYAPPRVVEGPNPILDAPLDAPNLPAIDATLNRPKAKRQRKAKTGKRPGRPAKAKAPEAEAPAHREPTPQTVVAAPPQHPFFAKPVSTTTGWAIGAMMFFLTVGAALGFWAIRP